jgi:hypothetical protein
MLAECFPIQAGYLPGHTKRTIVSADHNFIAGLQKYIP